MVKYKNVELAYIVKKFGKELLHNYSLSPQQVKALNNIVSCRTALLGGHEVVCDSCAEITYEYNSCGDRHCPKCQLTKQAIWVDDLCNATLPIKHYHIIFTVPHVLNDVCLWNSRMYYSILFKAVWSTLNSFGYSHFGAQTAAIAILHSWGQNLSLHPHIHCLVPAAGLHINGTWKKIGATRSYLYPVHQLSQTFEGKFLHLLKRALKRMNNTHGFDSHIQKAQNKKWVVYSESSMAKAEHVMHYLGQYTHRIAISNNRILKVTDTHVTFIAKDYKDNNQQKPVTLSGVEFLRRFVQHVMPNRFVRIRRFGMYNHTLKAKQNIEFFSEADKTSRTIKTLNETKQERVTRLIGYDSCKCKTCKIGTLIRFKEIPRIRSPTGYLPSILSAKLL